MSDNGYPRPDYSERPAVRENRRVRLDSWKEIASYLRRSERTVCRWEDTEELPVHRQLHEKRGSVYAYTDELEAWRLSRRLLESDCPDTQGPRSSLPAVNQNLIEMTIDKPAKSTEPSRLWLPILSGAGVLAVGIVLWISFFKPVGTPRVVRFKQLTHDGQRKDGPILSDGVRIYFNESLPDGRHVIAQVSVKGGEVSPLPLTLKAPNIRDLSRDGTELLIASAEWLDKNSIWLQPVAGGSPRRIGAIIAGDAAFGVDETSIIYCQGHDVYAVNRDGSSARKLFTVEYFPAHFRFSPDHKHLRFTQHDQSSNILLLMSASADGTELRKMFHAGSGDWTPDGRYFIMVRRDPDYATVILTSGRSLI